MKFAHDAHKSTVNFEKMYEICCRDSNRDGQDNSNMQVQYFKSLSRFVDTL